MKKFHQLAHVFGNVQNAANRLLAACYQGVFRPLAGCERLVSGGAKKQGVWGAWWNRDRLSTMMEGAGQEGGELWIVNGEYLIVNEGESRHG